MKKILMLSLAITMVFASGASAKIIGDFNSDGKITLHDAIAFILHINGQKQIDEVGQELAGEDSESEDGVKLVRPELDISMPNAQAGLELLPEIAEIIDQVKDKVKATYLESGESDSFEFAGDNSGTVSVKMRMPDGYREYSGRNVDFAEVVLNNFSLDGSYFISGELSFSQ